MILKASQRCFKPSFLEDQELRYTGRDCPAWIMDVSLINHAVRHLGQDQSAMQIDVCG